MPGYESEQDKMATILKAQGLHPFAKMAVNIGKHNLNKIVTLTRYVQALARPKSYPFLDIDMPIAFMDQHALQKIQYDPLVGFVWFYQEQGELDTFGELVRAQEDVALGSGSEVAAVQETAKGKMPNIIMKKELGMDTRTSQEMLLDYRQFEARNPEPQDHEVLGETETDVVKRDVPKLVRYEGEGERPPTLPPWIRNERMPKPEKKRR